jgi:hypothetical protein
MPMAYVSPPLFVTISNHMWSNVIKQSGVHINRTAKTKYRNFETNIPRKGISGSKSKFPRLCVCV